MAFGCEVATIDLTMVQDEDETPAANSLVRLLSPSMTSQFLPQALPLPWGATAEGKTVKIPTSHGNMLVTALDGTRHRKRRKIEASLNKLLSRKRCQPMQSSQRLLAGFAFVLSNCITGQLSSTLDRHGQAHLARGTLNK
jgi:hypothetical protein